MRVMVTGAAGFIGSYLIPKLLDSGAEVVAFDIAKDPRTLSHLQKDIKYVRGDLGSSPDLYRAMMQHSISHVIHLGSILAGPCEENPARGFQINFQSTLALLDASVVRQVKRFIMTSSIAVFGEGAKPPVKDEDVKNPFTIYGQTKLACEHLLRWYHDRNGLSTGGVRFPWVFGPGRKTGITALYSSKLLDAIALNEPLEISNPEESGDWLYIRDAVKSLLLMLNALDTPRRVYNIMGGVHTIREVMEMAKKIKPEAKIAYIKGSVSPNPYPSSYDDTAARKDIGWKPDYTIEEAIREHISIVSGT